MLLCEAAAATDLHYALGAATHGRQSVGAHTPTTHHPMPERTRTGDISAWHIPVWTRVAQRSAGTRSVRCDGAALRHAAWGRTGLDGIEQAVHDAYALVEHLDRAMQRAQVHSYCSENRHVARIILESSKSKSKISPPKCAVRPAAHMAIHNVHVRVRNVPPPPQTADTHTAI